MCDSLPVGMKAKTIWVTDDANCHITCTNPIQQTALAYARVWHHYDASGNVLGKLSARIALILMGKHKPIYDPASTSRKSSSASTDQQGLILLCYYFSGLWRLCRRHQCTADSGDGQESRTEGLPESLAISGRAKGGAVRADDGAEA